MKFPFYKSILAAGAIALVCSCGDETASGGDINGAGQNTPTSSSAFYAVTEPSFVYQDKDKNVYLIQTSGIVTDTTGNVVGAINFESGLIVSMDQTVIAENVNIKTLQTLAPTIITGNAWVLNADQTYVIYPPDASLVDANGNTLGVVTDAAGNQIGVIAVAPGTLSGKIVAMDLVTPIVENVDLSSLTAYGPNVKVESSSSNDDTGSTNSSIGGDTSKSSSSAKSSSSTKSSSSSAKSSSSQAKSSSSVASSSNSQGSGFTIKYVNGGKSGSGYATRYWDCCKPHCAWPEHGGTANTCDAQGNKIGDKSASSMCDGGNAGICRGQFPIVYNDTIAFAFAATPGGENNCGKCFDLVFTGEGKYATDSNHKKIKGKHLIVMSNNVGYDVAGGQFDVMIPGGGFGIFDGCSAKMGWGSQGKQYGGLLSECEDETNYSAAKYKSCLTEKCNKSFSNDAQAKEGCLFLANWMNAAGNPLHNYKEVECPQELKDRY